MGRGRPRKPIEQMKLEGTYQNNKSRYIEREKNEKEISVLVGIENKSIPVPKTIQDKKTRKFFKDVTGNLQKMRLLSEVDLIEIEQMCIILQEIKKVNEAIANIDIIEDMVNFNNLSSLQIKLTNTFSTLAMKYYVSPKSRASIILDILEIEKKKNEVEQTKSPIQSILAIKES